DFIRSGGLLEPGEQEYVSDAGLAQSAMDAVIEAQIQIIPDRYAKSYLDWLSEKRDWPIGRQLWWGHQIPVWTKRFRGIEEQNRIATEEPSIIEDAIGHGEAVAFFMVCE